MGHFDVACNTTTAISAALCLSTAAAAHNQAKASTDRLKLAAAFPPHGAQKCRSLMVAFGVKKIEEKPI